jgi:hypothetical protein
MRVTRRIAAVLKRHLGSPLRLVSNIVSQRSHPRFSRRSQWSIGIYEGTTPFDLRDSADIANPVITASLVTDVKAEYVADPFMIEKDGTWYMYFEVFEGSRQKGEIGLATSLDCRQWSYQRIVLREPFHLSYPLVFKWREDYYLVPESAEANRIGLYRAIEFPGVWEYWGDLIEGSFADHALFRHEDMWWLLAGVEPILHNRLRLFYSEDLAGPWQEHPRSPIVGDDAKIARPGGRSLRFGGNVVRFAQDSAPTYGRALNAFLITKLTRTEYAERPFEGNPILKPGPLPWNMHGMHHLDAHELEPGHWVACVDGYRREATFRFEY